MHWASPVRSSSRRPTPAGSSPIGRGISRDSPAPARRRGRALSTGRAARHTSGTVWIRRLRALRRARRDSPLVGVGASPVAPRQIPLSVSPGHALLFVLGRILGARARDWIVSGRYRWLQPPLVPVRYNAARHARCSTLRAVPAVPDIRARRQALRGHVRALACDGNPGSATGLGEKRFPGRGSRPPARRSPPAPSYRVLRLLVVATVAGIRAARVPPSCGNRTAPDSRRTRQRRGAAIARSSRSAATTSTGAAASQ